MAPLSLDDIRLRIAGLPAPLQIEAWQCFRQIYPHVPTVPDPPPPPEIVTLRAQYRYDIRQFALDFFPHLCTDPFSGMHEDFFDDWRLPEPERGIKSAIAAPRANAKTTMRTTIKTIHECVYVTERFILIVGARQDLAEERVMEIREELESNTELLRVFGQQKTRLWNQGNIVTLHGVRVMAASRGQQIRGLIRRGIRPTKVLLDDAERSDEVLSEKSRDRFWRWLNGDVLKLGATGRTNYEMIGTILYPDSALARLMDNPGWRSRRYQAVLAFADQAPELWQQWREIYIGTTDEDGNIVSREQAQNSARAFFEAHRDRMLAGSQVLWPEREDYYSLMEMILTEGDLAFELEKQNNPILSQDHPYRMDEAAYFAIVPDGLLLLPSRILVPFSDLIDYRAYWDPAMGGEGEPDYSCCVVIAKDVRGYYYVLDVYIEQHDEPDDQVRNVVGLAAHWQVTNFGLETVAFQSLLLSNLREELSTYQIANGTDWSPKWIGVGNTRNKVLRIMSIHPMVTNRWILFNKDLPAEYFRQFSFFRPVPNAGKDDGPDATEGCIRVYKGSPSRKAGMR